MRFLQQRGGNRTHVSGIDGITINAECYYCHVPGHLSNNCPKIPVERRFNCGAGGKGSGGKTGTGMCQICVGLAQNDDGIIPSNWLLIDRFSTTSVGKNPDMSSNIRKILK